MMEQQQDSPLPASPVQPRPDSRMCFRTFASPLAVLLVFMAGQAMASESEAEQPKTGEEDFAIPNWSISTSLNAVVGYRDNVLLSPVNADGSGFIRGEADAMLLRVPTGNLDGYVYLNLLETRYFSADQTDHERSGFVTSEIRWQAGENLKFGLTGLAYHQDQVFDVSVTEVSLDTAQLKVTGATLAPFVRWNFSANWWLEARSTGRKDHFAENIDGYTQGEGSLGIGRKWESGSELSLTGERRWRSHDSREQYTGSGRPITGSLLKAQQNEFTVKYALVPDAKRQWKATFTATQEENRDNGTGYFDFNRRLFSAALSWKPAAWDVNLSAGFTDYDFPVQLVGIGIAPENRHKQEYRVTLEVTRRLTPALALLAGYETERAVSNDDRSRFRINTAYVGLQWTWDSLGSD